MSFLGVNLPRWGLKHVGKKGEHKERVKCKFTPLGFETLAFGLIPLVYYRVNLPRWGLKLYYDEDDERASRV